MNNLSLSFLKLFNIAQIFNNHFSTFHSAQYKQIGKFISHMTYKDFPL